MGKSYTNKMNAVKISHCSVTAIILVTSQIFLFQRSFLDVIVTLEFFSIKATMKMPDWIRRQQDS